MKMPSFALPFFLFLPLGGIALAASPSEIHPTIQACQPLAEGEACQFLTPDGWEDGQCVLVNSQLVCQPPFFTRAATEVETGTLIGSTATHLPDTGQSNCYDASGSLQSCPAVGQADYGQDAQYQGNALSYTNHGDGTVSDHVTGLMWQQSADLNGDGTINVSDKLSFDGATRYCDALSLGGHDDWWLPDIKQLYSLMDFDGRDISGVSGSDTSGLTAFIDRAAFDFGYGDTSAGERLIDAQYVSATRYVSTTMQGDDTMFGVNFADGRIKGYPLALQGSDKLFYVACARGNGAYGQNQFVDHGDQTITDQAMGLMWTQNDSAEALDWSSALAWVASRNAEHYLGHADWRLPDAKELQSLVDYTRAPDTTGSAAMNPLFTTSTITNEGGQADFPYFWTSTTHANGGTLPGTNAVYLAFGRALGYMNGSWLDVHGAGAQRSDPKTGDAANYPTGHGPQGDAIRIANYVRLVRDAGTTASSANPARFDATTNQLLLPVVDAGDLGYFQVTLQLLGTDERFTPGFLFELTAASPTTGTASASYAAATGNLTIPAATLGETVYQVDLALLPEGESMRFVVTGLRQ